MADVVLDERSAARVPVALRRIYGADAVASELVVDTPHGRRPAWVVASADGIRQGRAIADEVPGRTRLITILVAVGSDGLLKDLEILAYRESHGGEVAQESWRAQFRGRKAGDPLRVGRQIRNISGATISSNSVTKGVSRSLQALGDPWRTP